MQDEWVTDWEAENDKSVEYDDAVVWYPHRIVNRRDEARAWAEHEWLAAHEKKPWRNADFTSWSAERDSDHPHHRDDGVRWVVTQDMPAEDDWFSVAKKAPGDHHEPDDETDGRNRASHPGDDLSAGTA